jgi:hypothetical protein
MADVLKPSPALLCKLGSIIVHVEEGSGVDGHPFDEIALRGLLDDPEVKQWLDGMAASAFLLLKRR